MTISIIVAVADNLAIGGNGDLLWHIPADLRRFKTLTLGHTIIMGRKTWDSLPKGALPGRRNVVITRNQDFVAPGADVFQSAEEALASCGNDEHVFIIGGAQIYSQTIGYADTLFLTEVYADFPKADAFFPKIDLSEWEITNREECEGTEPLKYCFIDFKRKNRHYESCNHK